MSDLHLLVTVEDGVGSIIFNRSERLNAISMDMANQLVLAVHRMERDSEVRCVLI